MNVLLERKGDTEPYARANEIHKKLVSALEGMNPTKFPFEMMWMGENIGTCAPLHKLGVVDYDDFDSDLCVGFQLGDEKDPVSNGEFYARGSLDFAMGGLILLGFNRFKQHNKDFAAGHKRRDTYLRLVGSDKWASIEDVDMSALFSARKSTFIHEYVHYWDFTYRLKSRKLQTYGEKSINDREGKKNSEELYFTSPVETNAYFQQAFDDLVDLFEDKFVDPTKEDAKRFAASSTVLWNKFLKELEPGVSFYVKGDKLLKLYAARLTDAWDKYVSGLK